MSHLKDILPENAEGEFNGYCESYHFLSDGLWWKGVMVNGNLYGYYHKYNSDGSFNDYWSGYFLNDEHISTNNEEGYCYIWDKEEYKE